MPSVVSSNPFLQSTIEKLIAVLQEGGAFVHPDLQVKFDQQGLSVCLPDVSSEKRLIVLRGEHLLNINALNITLDEGLFNYSIKPEAHLSDLQKRLFEYMFIIYNESGRVGHCLSTFPRSNINNENAYSYYDFLLDKFAISVDKELSFNNNSELISSESPEQIFFKTRIFEYKKTNDIIAVPVVMPLLDFLNHHWDGSAFQQKCLSNEVSLGVNAKQIRGVKECFAFYGPLDALDCYLHYGFVDQSAPVVRSIPLSMKIDGFGEFVFASKSVEMFGKKLNGNLRGLNKHMPKLSFDHESKVLNISHIFIPSMHSPLSMRKILFTLLQIFKGHDVSLEKLMPYVLVLEDSIVEQNINFYQNLKNRATLLLKSADSISFEFEVLLQLINLQLSKIENYDRLRKGFKY